MLDFRDDHLDGDCVVPSTRHDDVRITLAWLDELQMHRVNGFEILRDHLFQCPPPFDHVAFESSHESNVRVGVDEDLDVAQRPQLLIDKQQNSIEDQYVGGVHALGAVSYTHLRAHETP